MKYSAALVLSGLVWTLLAFALGHFTVPFWMAIVPGITTAFFVGFVLKDTIKKARGLGWFALPLASIVLGSSAFGALFVSAMWLAARFMHTEPIQGAAIFVSAMVYAWVALTYFIWATYPASLLTHYLLRRFALPKDA